MTVYRHQIRPVIKGGAEQMDPLFAGKIPTVSGGGRHQPMTGHPDPRM